MKKFLLVFCVILISVCMFAACNDEHAHTFSDEWTSDAGNHWHSATCEHTDEKSDVAAHTWDAGRVTAEPTEAAQGVKTFTCTVCAATKTESVPALSHTHTYTASVTAPTCESAGFTTHTCACGDSYTDTSVAALGHAYGGWTADGEGHHSRICAHDATHTERADCAYNAAVTAPTCEVAGFTAHTCAVCADSYTDTPVAALGHDWEIDGVGENGEHLLICGNDAAHTKHADCEYTPAVTDPTCEDDGYVVYTCACAHTYTEPGESALGHEYGAWTSQGDGTHFRVCERDDTHVHSEECVYGESETDPDCTTGGYTTYTCALCSDSYTDDETEPTGHSFSAEWSTNDAYHWHEAICGHSERSSYEAHKFTEFVAIVAPTCDTEGYTTYRCQCGKTENRDMEAALGHSYGEFEEKSRILFDESCCQYAVTYATVCSQCGDPQQKVEYTEIHNFYYEKEDIGICAVTGENALRKPTCQTEGVQHKHCASPECRYYADAAEAEYYEDPDAHLWDEGVANGSVTTYTCTLCQKTKNTARVEGDTADISGGLVDEVEIGQTTINMNEEMKDTLTKDNTDVSITAGVTEDDQAKRELLEQYGFTLDDVGSQPIYSFTVTGASEENFGNGGVATITIPYTLGDNDDRNNIIVFYISNGKLQAIEAEYFEKDGQGYATFQTSHFSDYVPMSVNPEELCELFGEHSGERHVVEPTCITGGYTVCLRCNQIIETTSALGHKWLSEVAQATTCEQNGVIRYACAECDASFETILPATGHYHVLSAFVAASCQNEGRSVYGCIYCDDEYTVTQPQLSHQYLAKTAAPTCEVRGYTQRTCTLCADVQTSYVPALGHSFGTGFEKAEEGHYHTCTVCGGRDEVQLHEPGEPATEAHAQLCTVCEYVIAPQLTHQHKNMTHHLENEPTCTQNGNKEYFVCACGKWFLDEQGTQLVTDHASVVLLAHGHTNEDIAYVAPTCTQAGNTAGVKCAVCDTLLKGNIRIAPTGHDYAQSVIRPTCDEGGYTTYTCACGDTYESNETAPLGHRYSVEVTAPTCETGGYTTYTCQKCSHTYEGEQTAALGHSFAAAWKTDAVGHWHECARCGVKTDAAVHNKDYESATEEHGVSCTVCGLVLESIKDHTHAVKTAYNAQEPTCERSGKKEYFVCSCGDWFFDAACTQLIANRADVVIPAAGHQLVHEEQVAPTCQSAGISAGYSCVNCSFAAGRMPIDPIAHKFVELKRDANGHWYKCATCNETTASEAHDYDTLVIQPGCTTPGYTEFSCDCGYEYVGDNQPATGHSFGAWECNYDGTHTRVCAADPRHQQTVLCEYVVQVVEPTCEKSGYTLKSCECGYVTKDQYVPATGHAYGEWTSLGDGQHVRTCANDPAHTEIKDCTYVTEVTAPTCTEPGYTTYTCTACGYSYVADEVAALGHSYEAVVTAPTCTEGGYTTYTCAVCADSYVADEVAALGHTWNSGVITTDPTCTEEGVKTFTCELCGDTYTDEVAALGHSYEAVVTAPTCTEAGYTTYTCACGDSYVADEVAALGHTWNSGVITTDPTCTEEGVKTFTCELCGDTYTDEVAALGHSYEAVVTAPTCTEAGYTTYTCACGDSYADDEVAALGHTWNGGVITTDPTETDEGVKTFTCEVCGETRTESVPALGHTHAYTASVTAPSCTEGGYTTYTCRCGDSYVADEVAALGHRHEAVVTAPTCTEDGYTTYTCACGDTYTANEVAALGHRHEAVVTAPTCTAAGYTTYTCACGDSYVDDEVAALGHTWNSGVITTDPTCSEKGVKTFTCEVCGDTYTDEVAALGHTWNSGVITTDPTETDEGVKTFTCEVCGATRTESVPALGHTHAYTASVTAPSCTEGGYTTYTCACGDSYVGDEVAALGHSYEAVVTAPTCTESGYTTCTCACGASYTEAYVNPLGHDWKPGAANGDGTHKMVCSRNAAHTRDARCQYGQGVVTEPSCTEPGYTTYTCKVCADSSVEDEVAALGHSFKNGVCQNCGERGEVEYATNTFAVEIVHDESGATYLKVTAKNMDLAGVLFTLSYGDYQCESVECPENATAYDAGGVVNYVFSGGENTVGDLVLLELRLNADGARLPNDSCQLSVQQIYRFADNGELEIPAYTVINVQ